MRILLPLLGLGALLLAGCQPDSDSAAVAPAADTVPETATAQVGAVGTAVENRYIVVLEKSGLSGLTDLVSQVEALAASYGIDIDRVYEHALDGFVGEMPAAVAALLALDPLVAYVEQDRIVGATATQANATWGLDRIDQEDLPLDSNYQFASNGAGAHAYIIDTGIRSSHSEFSGRLGNGYNTVGGGGLLGIGGAAADPNDTEDCNGHGSHVAGTVGGSEFGVAKGSTLHPVRVLDCNGSGLNSGVIAGVDWVMANHQKPAVANMSLGGGNSTALDDAVRAAINAGVSFVVAAGNDNADACTGSPNRVAEAVTVGSTTASDTRSSFSNKGTCVDIFAPGSSIRSAGISNDSSTATMSGTSMAAPHVAGIAALYLAANPAALPGEVFSSIIAAAVSNRLSGIGAGSPNVLAQNDVAGAGADLPPVARMTIDCSDLQCSFDASASSDDNAIASYLWDFGDGAVSTAVQTTHAYSAAGTYTVSLVVRDDADQTDSLVQSLVVAEAGSAPCTNCTHSGGTLANGEIVYIPAQGISTAAGRFQGFLEGPASADFDLRLEKYSCSLFFCSWSSVARAETNSSSETIDYTGSAGDYRWRVSSYSGSGSFDFWYAMPN